MFLSKIKNVIEKIKSSYDDDNIPLHRPTFKGNEKDYVIDAIDSTFVSSIGQYVNKFEDYVSDYTSIKNSVATVNGTSSLHIALKLSGVKENDEVITQPLTFVATVNAIKYLQAIPVFVDVNSQNFGMCSISLENFLVENAEMRSGQAYNKISGNRIKACLPMHTFGFICDIERIVIICRKWNIKVVEDCAEAFGSFFNKKSAGNFGCISAFSFNGNKIITAGGGGVICTNDKIIASKAKHLTTTAKKNHKWEYFHDEVGYNYRMPNINAALICAQIERLNDIKRDKKELYNDYKYSFSKQGIELCPVPKGLDWNYWLFSLKFDNIKERNTFLKYSHKEKVLCRPVWNLIYELPMYKDSYVFDNENSKKISDTIVNIPSSERN